MNPVKLRMIRLGCAGALLGVLLCVAATAHCAVWVKLSFTAPADSVTPDGRYVSGVGRYRVETTAGVVWDSTGWDSLRIYRAPGVEGVPVLPGGSPCSLYVSQTVAPLTSRTYRLLSIDNRGNRSESSNYVVVATGFPDTLVGLSRPGRHAFRRTHAQPVGWKLAEGDTSQVRALHQEDIQRQYQARICQLFGFWALRGVRVPCPSPGQRVRPSWFRGEKGPCP